MREVLEIGDWHQTKRDEPKNELDPSLFFWSDAARTNSLSLRIFNGGGRFVAADFWFLNYKKVSLASTEEQAMVVQQEQDFFIPFHPYIALLYVFAPLMALLGFYHDSSLFYHHP